MKDHISGEDWKWMRELIKFTEQMRDGGYHVLKRKLVVILRALWGSVHVLQIAHPNIIDTLRTYRHAAVRAMHHAKPGS